VRLQRQRRVLSKRLRVPPSLNVFTKTMDKTTTMNVFKFLSGYKPETKQKKAERLRGEAEARAAGKTVEKSKPFVLKYGLNHVTGLIEQKKAQLVLIAHDVSPIELVLWLPNLCKKMNVPFAIVKNKANLGVLCNKKSATCVAVTRVKPEDKATFEKLVEAVNENYGQIYATASRKWGGNILGLKSQYKIDSRLAAVEREAAVKSEEEGKPRKLSKTQLAIRLRHGSRSA